MHTWPFQENLNAPLYCFKSCWNEILLEFSTLKTLSSEQNQPWVSALRCLSWWSHTQQCLYLPSAAVVCHPWRCFAATWVCNFPGEPSLYLSSSVSHPRPVSPAVKWSIDGPVRAPAVGRVPAGARLHPTRSGPDHRTTWQKISHSSGNRSMRVIEDKPGELQWSHDSTDMNVMRFLTLFLIYITIQILMMGKQQKNLIICND